MFYKINKALNIFILFGILLLPGCGASDAPIQYGDSSVSIEEPKESGGIMNETTLEEDTLPIEETEPAHDPETVSDDEQWNNRIYVTADEIQGNILGYSLIRMPPNPENMYYEQDMPYLLDEDIVGKGIYVSDYICETEVFLGNILKEVLTSRGAVSTENRQYFTEYVLQQLADTDWESLDEEWEPDPYAYDREYCMEPVFGGSGNRFFYSFYPDKEKAATEETNKVDITLYVDGDGKIRDIKTSISMVPTEENRIEKWISMEGLFDDTYSEQVIRDGSPCKEEMVWDFERHFRRFMAPDEVYEQNNVGLLESGKVCASAEKLADIFLHVMESRGTDVEKYAEWFGYDKDFSDFADTDWKSLGEEWIAKEEYDCFFIDKIYFSGYVGFRFYFFPDFKTMGVDTANMVVIDCNVDVYEGMLCYTNIDIFPVTEEEYLAMKRNQAESRVPVVEKGTVLLEKTKVAIPVLDRPVMYMPISEFDPSAVAENHSRRKVKNEIWGFTDAAEAGDYLGKKFLQDFAEDNVEAGKIYELAKDKEDILSVLYAIGRFMDDGWKADKQYDCFYVKSNEAEGCMHLQYFFYPERVGEEQTKNRTLVVDMYLSESGIENMEMNSFVLDWKKNENENPYFYNREQASLQVHAEYHNGTEFVDEIADAEIYRVKIYERGCVYRMIVYIEPFMSSWYFKSGEPLNIYFYVTADKIYRILPYAQPELGGRSIDLYDDDNLLTETLDTDEKLQNNSIVVCQEEELQQEYSSITKDGNKITYYLSETKVNGEPGGEDLFVWEQGKGLVEFGTGFGPGPMDVHINEIQVMK